MADTSVKVPMITVSGQQFVMGFCIIALWAMVLTVLAFVTLPDNNRDAFNLFLGGILGAGTTVLAFYFPSSVGSRAKDEAITKLTDAVTAPKADGQ